MDAAVMGDFLYSFHYTESASQELTNHYTRTEHIGHAVADLARGAGFVTLPAALLLVFRRDALRRPGIRSLLALLALTLGIFALLLLDGMPNERYLIVPAYLVILLAALAATPDLGAGSRVGRRRGRAARGSADHLLARAAGDAHAAPAGCDRGGGRQGPSRPAGREPHVGELPGHDADLVRPHLVLLVGTPAHDDHDRGPAGLTAGRVHRPRLPARRRTGS